MDTIIFALNNSYFITSKTIIKQHLLSNLKYVCKQAGTLRPENIVKEPLFDMKKIGVIGAELVYLYAMLCVLNTSIQLFTLQPMKQIVSTVSHEVLYHSGSYVGASHCQEGQGGMIYKIIESVAEEIGVVEENNISVTSEATTNEVHVLIKNIKYNFPVTETTTILNVKELIATQFSVTDVSKIRLIYGGKILQNEQLVKDIINYNTITISGVIASLGGTRRKSNKGKSNKGKSNKKKHNMSNVIAYYCYIII